MHREDTIVAIASAPGQGGVGIVRLSGRDAKTIALQLSERAEMTARHAHYAKFYDADQQILDDGLLLYFPGPASFTGEDVVELQAHGSPVVLKQLVKRSVALGARHARPGEFSERAFHNEKIDLAQAEAIADLIAASDEFTARAARRALQGDFSKLINIIATDVLHIRIHIEASIDFADEPIDTLSTQKLTSDIEKVLIDLDQLHARAQKGQKLRDGFHVVIVGPPNAGKSSLLNQLAGTERAIVTDIAGTTRDVLRESIVVDGIEISLADTAGFRAQADAIEQEGIRRARQELDVADLILAVIDAREPQHGIDAVPELAQLPQHILWIYNKADLISAPHFITPAENTILLSAQTGQGVDTLYARIKAFIAEHQELGNEVFTARARHVHSIEKATDYLKEAQQHLHHDMPELAAENLRLAHDELGTITGRVTPDDLLGHIFSTFCIGK